MRFLGTFAIAAAVLAAVAAVHYSIALRTDRAAQESSELLNVRLGGTAIARALEDVASDLMFLARHNELQGAFERGESAPRSALASQFLVLSAQKGKYDQIRLLDQAGMETVRVNYNNGNPEIVPDDQLQSKAGRYYMDRTWELERGDVYISPMDLNVENETIELPLKPMIRFGTPVFDRAGDKAGVLLLNFLGEQLIRDFNTAAANISDHVMLLNADGFWLSSPEREDEWGFMFGNDRSFRNDFPGGWRRIMADEVGQFYSGQGMISFATIHPLAHAGSVETAAAGQGYYWKAVSVAPPLLLTTGLNQFFERNLFLYGAMLFVLAVTSYWIARATAGREQAVSEADRERRFRGRLEERVSEGKRELGTARELLSAILDNAGDAVISIGGDQRVIMFNKRAELLFGYSAEEAVGMPMEELIPEPMRADHARSVERFLASGETSRRMGSRLEITGLRRDRSKFPAEAAISRVEAEGHIIATVMIRDVTERVQQMKALRESEARVVQAEKMAALGTMASGIGHEINNPLYSILGAAEALREEDDISRSRGYGSDILDQSRRIAEIVRSLAGYARPSEEHDLESVDVNERLRAAVAMAKRSLNSDHVEIDEDLSPVPTILAKSEEIQQTFYNVVRNGIQSMTGGGTLSIRSRQKGDEVVIEVCDTGAGIAVEHMAKVFDPFFTTKGPDEGEGLGLYVVRQIVEKYRGTIFLEDRNGPGTLCRIKFPAEMN